MVLGMFRETRAPVILAHRTSRDRKHTAGVGESAIVPNGPPHHLDWTFAKHFLKNNVIRPFSLLVTEPVVFFFTLLSALSYGLLFIATQSVPQVYGTSYAFTEPQTGLIQASIVVGEVLGFLACACIGGPYFARASTRSAKVAGGNPQLSEVRLYLAVPSLLLGVTGGLFVYGWTSYADLTYWAPTAGLLLIGFGSVVVMQAIMMYITDSYTKYAASASAAVCFGENIAAAYLPLASQSMYTNLGLHWASTLLAFFALALSCAPVVLVFKGRAIRERSVFMREAIYGPLMSAASREDAMPNILMAQGGA